MFKIKSFELKLHKLIFGLFELSFPNSESAVLISRFIGNLDLCGQQVQKPCRTSLGFPAVLPRADSDEARGN